MSETYEETYEPKVYKDEGGDRQVVGEDGELLIKSGGKLHFEDGALIEDDDNGNGIYVVIEPDDITLEIGNDDKLQVVDEGIDESKLADSIAGAGLIGGAGDPLAVNIDDDSLEIDGDSGKLQIKSQNAIADLNMTAATTFDSTELDAVAARVDAILAALRLAKVIKTDGG